MNWKQRIIKKYVVDTFAQGSVTITENGSDSLHVKDLLGESLVFWLDDATGNVYDEFHHPEAYKAWRDAQQHKPNGITVEVDADTSGMEKKLDVLTEKAHALESTMVSVSDKIDAAIEKAGNGHLTYNEARAVLGATPLTEQPTRHAPRFDTVPEDPMPPEDQVRNDDFTYDYVYGPGFGSGALVFCPDCGHAVRSGYSGFKSQAEADQYARENCPECHERAEDAKRNREAMAAGRQEVLNRRKDNELARRVQFVRDLEHIVRKAETTVCSLEHVRPGKDGETVVIRYSGTETKVPISGDSLLAIAKSVMEALPY